MEEGISVVDPYAVTASLFCSSLKRFRDSFKYSSPNGTDKTKNRYLYEKSSLNVKLFFTR